MPYVLRRRAASLAGTLVLLQIHFLLLVAPPESLGEDVVHATPPSVHADGDAVAFVPNPLDIRFARVLRPLIAVDDFRAGRLEGVLQRLDHEPRRQRVRKCPRDHVAGVPVQKHRKIHEAAPQPDVGDVRPPRVVRMIDVHSAQKIGELRTLVARAQFGSGVYREDSHVSHETLNPFARYGQSPPRQHRPHPPGAVARMQRVDLVDPPAEQQFFLRERRGDVVQPASVQTEQPGLPGERDLFFLPVDERSAFMKRKSRHRIFF